MNDYLDDVDFANKVTSYENSYEAYLDGVGITHSFPQPGSDSERVWRAFVATMKSNDQLKAEIDRRMAEEGNK